MRKKCAALCLIAALSLVPTVSPAQPQPAIIVFAAASLKNALDDASTAFTAATHVPVKISYGGSVALARQVIAGAPADVFIAADEASMDLAAQQNAVIAASRFDLLGNTLVVIANKTASFDHLALTPEAFAKALGDGRLATGDVHSVPVGEYARSALQSLNLWSVVEPHLAMSDNVRAAMVFVAKNEAPLGIVYATDAAAEPEVKIVARFPAASHLPIVYPVAEVTGRKNAASGQFTTYLRSGAAKPIFEKQGFEVLAPVAPHS